MCADCVIQETTRPIQPRPSLLGRFSSTKACFEKCREVIGNFGLCVIILNDNNPAPGQECVVKEPETICLANSEGVFANLSKIAKICPPCEMIDAGDGHM
jgi:hypothetical protein